MKPPVRVWVVLTKDGSPTVAELSAAEAEPWCHRADDTVRRYRLDPPKRKASPARQNVAGGVIRKAKKRAGRK